MLRKIALGLSVLVLAIHSRHRWLRYHGASGARRGFGKRSMAQAGAIHDREQ